MLPGALVVIFKAAFDDVLQDEFKSLGELNVSTDALVR